MRKCCVAVVLAAGLALAGVEPLHAQAQKPAADQKQAEEAANVVPLQVDVVVTHWKGDKKTSSQPYTLSVNTGRPGFPSSGGLGQPVGPVTRIRIGNEVPVTSVIVAPAAADGKESKPSTSFTYRTVGMQIDCSARPIGDGQFELQVSLSESGVTPGDTQTRTGTPVFSSFTATNNLLLRDGQTRQFVAATDAVSGEVIRADVTLKVLK